MALDLDPKPRICSFEIVCSVVVNSRQELGTKQDNRVQLPVTSIMPSPTFDYRVIFHLGWRSYASTIRALYIGFLKGEHIAL